MTIPNPAPSFICPSCGGTVTAIRATVVESYHPGYHVFGTALPTRKRDCVAAACSGCEFCVELPEEMDSFDAFLVDAVRIFQ